MSRGTEIGMGETAQSTPSAAWRPLVSVVMAYRNEESYLSECLDSLSRQTYTNFEIVAADGMSTDRSHEIVAGYSGAGGPIRIYVNPHSTADHGFNVAISHAKGDVIALVGAHCMLAPTYLERCIDVLAETGADVVGGPLRTSADGYVGRAIALALSSRFGTGSRFRYSRSEKPQEVDTVAYGAYRAELFDEYGLFDTTIPELEDLEFNRRLVKAGKRILMHGGLEAVYRCRSTLAALIIRNLRTGGYVVRHFLRDQNACGPRHLVPLVFLLSLLATGAAAPFSGAAKAVLIAEVGVYTCLTVLFSVITAAKGGLRYLPMLIVIFPAYHVTYGLGGIRGLADSLRVWARRP